MIKYVPLFFVKNIVMIKAKIQSVNGNSSLYIFGLTAMNIQKLQEGKPMYIKLEEMGGEGEILIIAGETEKSIMRELQEFIGPDTNILHGLPLDS